MLRRVGDTETEGHRDRGTQRQKKTAPWVAKSPPYSSPNLCHLTIVLELFTNTGSEVRRFWGGGAGTSLGKVLSPLKGKEGGRKGGREGRRMGEGGRVEEGRKKEENRLRKKKENPSVSRFLFDYISSNVCCKEFEHKRIC